MNRQQLKFELDKIVQKFICADTMYDGNNVVVAFTSEAEQERIFQYAQANNLMATVFANVHIVVGKTTYIPKKISTIQNDFSKSQFEKEVFGTSEVHIISPEISHVDKAIIALMHLESNVNEAIHINDSLADMVTKLQSLRQKLTQKVA